MNREEYREIVLRHKDRVYSYASYLLSNKEDARDVAQESLVRLWQNRAKVPAEGGAAKAWLTRTAHNLCMDRLRLRSSRPETGAEILEYRPAPPEAGGADPDVEIYGEQLRERIREALAELSPRDRAVIVMREVQGLSYEEMTAHLSLPMGTLKAVIHRARHRLREKLLEIGLPARASERAL